MSNTMIMFKTMPQKFTVSDGGNNFILGRRAFLNKTFLSHQINNLSTNNSSINNPAPLPQLSSDTRTQRLRLTTIGSGSYKLNNVNDSIMYKQSDHKNVIKHAITSVRGGGAAFVPKPNSIPK